MTKTKALYNENASKWLRLAPSSLSDFTARPYVFEAAGDVTGQSILDIGCGEGYCARELKKRGAAHITGIDLSESMIQIAKEQDETDKYGIDYQAIDVTEFSTDKEFDKCIAVFLFNYLSTEQMQAVMTKVYTALKPGGSFIFSVPHPFFPFLKKNQDPPFYFESEGKNYFADKDKLFEGNIYKQDGEKLGVQCVHKRLFDYFNCLKSAGFNTLPFMKELTVTEELKATNPEFFGPLKDIPLHIVFKIEK